MDRIFDQLDTLGRNTRKRHRSRPDRPAYNPPMPPEHGHDPFAEQYMDEPLTLDSFDHQLLRQPDPSTRLGQAALGHDRLSLPPTRAAVDVQDPRFRPSFAQSTITYAPPPRFDSSRLAYDSHQDRCRTPSSFDQYLPSSPALKASLRHAAPLALSQPVRSSHLLEAMQEPSQTQKVHALTANASGFEHNTAQLLQSHVVQPDLPDRVPRILHATHREGDPPVVQGINLISTQALPDRFRSIFPFPILNAVQSKCFDAIYNANDNFVLSAPTGSGKTAVLELAICRLVNYSPNGSFKIVYQAPTKSLCSERQRDWQKKFAPLDLQCAELTGDTETSQLRSVQNASIIIATPEKWDSVTRKWKDHQKLMHMVKLFLIDEVHMLKEDRGATLEAVVSRMKSVDSDVRFVALSATVPNSQDIALWLGQNPTNGHLPASREKFGEEFRPVRLEKHVCGYHSTTNDFGFDKSLGGKLPDVIKRWSQRKPIMVFCFTRSACVETAKLLAVWWASGGPAEQYWNSPKERIVVADKDLRDVISSGVAFHHAGLTMEDRAAVESGYLNGNISVICCTSTLAVGVNLPCHMVIIKNTVSYQSNAAAGCKEYSDLEIMQMLGRAGRPQFDDSAVAVIMTRLPRVRHYEKMVSGQEIVESCLHVNLIDHLNAEIGLGTITSVPSAKKWLMGTFLYVRLKDNPDHYKIDGDARRHNLDERLQTICGKALAMLEEHNLVSNTPSLRCTEFGDAMARYYVRFDTMKTFLALPPQARISEILWAISQASEFREVRFRPGEKTTYKHLNKNGSIKFPIPVNLDAPAHKVSLIIQSVLGAVDLSTEDHRQRTDYNTAKSLIFQHASRLVRCIIDCQICREDSFATRNALMLARSLAAQVWDDSPLHMKQLDSVGLVTVRKLVAAGINSIEDLEATEAPRIERALTRNPPYGTQLQEKARAFPKPQVSVRMAGAPVVQSGEHVTIKLRTEISFLNEKIPGEFHRKPVYVCLLAETSDGKLLQFARISAKKLNRGQDVLFEGRLTNPSQSIRVYVMCDDLAGTLRYATLMPHIPPTAFPAPKPASDTNAQDTMRPPVNASGREVDAGMTKVLPTSAEDEFDDEYINDADLARAEFGEFLDIDELDLTAETAATDGEPPKKKQKVNNKSHTAEPEQLANGKWACSHHCKDKTACKHLCCRQGLDKKPKPSKPKTNPKDAEVRNNPKQTQLKMPAAKRTAPTPKSSTSTKAAAKSAAVPGSKEALELNRLHSGAKTHTPSIATFRSTQAGKESAASLADRPRRRPSFLGTNTAFPRPGLSDYGDDIGTSDDLPDIATLVNTQPTSRLLTTESHDTAPDEEMLNVMGSANENGQQRNPDQIDDGCDFCDPSWLVDDEDFLDEEAGEPSEDLFHGIEATGLMELGDGKAAQKTYHPFETVTSIPLADREIPTRERMDNKELEANLSSATLVPNDETIDTILQISSNHPRTEGKRSDGVLRQTNTVSDTATLQPEATPPIAEDELEKWFHKYLGPDLFHYTG